jgi:glucose-1-phosphate thymidylyltransferase
MYSLIVENIKCIIAAGGLGTRLQDFRGNKSTKILLDVKGTSMISRQISQLYKWGMRKFVIITNPEYLDMVKEDTLNKFDNLNIDFTVQEEPKGISHALYQARDYVDQNEKIFFVLGDNFFENNPFNNFHLDKFEEGACIFTTEVSNPEEFGVAEIDGDGKVLSIEEKPHHPKSNAAVVGIYMFDDTVFKKIETLEPSARGEYEVTDLCNIYVNENKCLNLDLNGWWIDAGTPERIIELEEKLS